MLTGCDFEEPEEGRTPEPQWYETWTTSDLDKVIRNDAAKLVVAIRWLERIRDTGHSSTCEDEGDICCPACMAQKALNGLKDE